MPGLGRVLVFMVAAEEALAITEAAEEALAITEEVVEADLVITEVAEADLVITTGVVGVALVIMVAAGEAPAGFGGSSNVFSRIMSELIRRIYWKKIPVCLPLME